MTITYPLALPPNGARSVRVNMRDVVGAAESPFTLSVDVQPFAGQRWEADVEYPPMRRPEAVALIAFLASLKGKFGTFLMPVDPLAGAPRGTWAGSPLVVGAHAAGASSVALDGFTAGATVKAGDFFQVGTGATSRLHMVLADGSETGGAITVDIWPNLRASLLDNAAIVTTNPKCLWQLASNERPWDIGLSQVYGLRFTAIERLT